MQVQFSIHLWEVSILDNFEHLDVTLVLSKRTIDFNPTTTLVLSVFCCLLYMIHNRRLFLCTYTPQILIYTMDFYCIFMRNKYLKFLLDLYTSHYTLDTI